MATKVQLKRSTVSGRAPNTTSSGNSTYIAAGELAINLTDGKLFSSNGTALITVGSNLDSLSVNSIALTGRITANSSNGTSGQVLTSGGTGNVYWSTIGGGSVLTVSNYTANAYVNAISNVSQIAFNTSTGISVQDLGSGVGLVSLGSSFKTWNVAGQTSLVAVGEDTVRFIAGNNVTITTNATSIPQQIRFDVTSSGGGANVALTANTSDTQTFYFPMSNATSGSWSNAVMDTTDLYYVPSTGKFSVPTVSLTGNVYTTANNTGLVSGTDQAYVGTFNNSNYLLIVANGLMDQSGPFTMEGWFYPTTWSNWLFGYDNYQTYGVRIDVSTGNRFILHRHYVGDLATSTSNNFSTNTWYHVALSSNGSTTQLYVNGSLQIDVAGGGYDANSSLMIGGDGNGRFQGKISNFRFVGGTQVYTGNFTTPTGPLTAVASANPFGGSNTAAVTGTATKLLTLQNSTIIDNSSYAVTIANSGVVNTSLQSVPFPNQGRLVFDSNTWQSTALTVTNNITLNGSLTANSSNGTSGQVLTSSGTGGVYWSNVSGGGGSGVTIVANSTSTQTFYFPMSNTTSGSWSNAVVDSTDLFYVPSTNLLTVPSANITTSLTTPSANITTSLNVVGTVTVNGAFAVNNTAAVGNSTVTGFINASSYGRFGGIVNATSFNSTGNVTSTFANNVTVTGTVNATSISANGITVVGKVTANAATGTAGQVLTSGGAAGNVYWSTISGGGGGGGTYSGPGITSSATAPATPAEGDFWYITDLKILTVYTLEAGQYFWLDITGRTIAGTIENPFLSNDILFPAIFPGIPPLLLMAAYD